MIKIESFKNYTEITQYDSIVKPPSTNKTRCKNEVEKLKNIFVNRERSIRRIKQQIFKYIASAMTKPIMITLTFRDNNSNRYCKCKLTEFSKKFKYPFIAVAERQSRGAIHFHIITSSPPNLYFFDRDYKKDNESFAKMYWDSGFVHISRYKDVVDNDCEVKRVVNYMVKYITKNQVSNEFRIYYHSYFCFNMDRKSVKEVLYFESENDIQEYLNNSVKVNIEYYTFISRTSDKTVNVVKYKIWYNVNTS